MMECACWLRSHQGGHAVVAIQSGKLTKARIAREVQAARSVLLDDLAGRLHVTWQPTTSTETGGVLPDWLLVPQIANAISGLGRHAATPARSAFPIVFGVLLRDLLSGRPRRSRREIQDITGLSYPAVAGVLDELKPYMETGYRAVRLTTFPTPAWQRVLAMQPTWRKSYQFRDSTNVAFKPERFLRQLRELKRSDIALGGVVGARYYHDIDLVGVPRLDLTLHVSAGQVDLGWFQKIAPELQACSAGVPARVAIHTLRRTAPLFLERADSIVADPAEILLDLVDLRLDDQADAFAKHCMETASLPA